VIRTTFVFGMLLALALTLGCGGVKEVTPEGPTGPAVNEAEVQKQIEEGMKKGGAEYKKYDK